jgi:hypothetical protein
MAKKDYDEDEDWFEDELDESEEDNEKPKKGKKQGKKKDRKVFLWIAAFVVILAILLLIRFKYAVPAQQDVAQQPEKEASTAEAEEESQEAEEEAEQETMSKNKEREYEEAGVYEAPKHIGPDVVEKEDLPHVEEVVDTTTEPELFSNLECNYDYDSELLYISLRIYNVLGEDILISPRGISKGYNTYFLIRGVVDTDPGCGTELLQPGEWTECSKIGFDAPRFANVPGINRLSVQVPGKTEALLIECPEAPETSSEE